MMCRMVPSVMVECSRHIDNIIQGVTTIIYGASGCSANIIEAKKQNTRGTVQILRVTYMNVTLGGAVGV